jgi:hypothetical protein
MFRNAYIYTGFNSIIIIYGKSPSDVSYIHLYAIVILGLLGEPLKVINLKLILFQ